MNGQQLLAVLDDLDRRGWANISAPREDVDEIREIAHREGTPVDVDYLAPGTYRLRVRGADAR